MKAFIYTGGNIFKDNITEKPEDGDLKIAADSGYKNAIALGVSVDMLVGDFDSLEHSELEGVNENIQIVTVPSEKDFTDTQLAVKLALEKGASYIVIIGGLDGRLDHTISNLAILESLYLQSKRGLITDGKNRVRYIKNSSELISRSAFKYLSLLAVDEKVKGVEIEGCKYPLKNATILRKHQFAVSNEISKNCALISVKKGGIYIIESAE